MFKKLGKKIAMFLVCSSIVAFNSVPAFASTPIKTSTSTNTTLTATTNWEFMFQRQFYYAGGTPYNDPAYVGANGTGVLFWCISSWWGNNYFTIDPKYTYRVDIAYDYGPGYRGFNSLTGVENLQMAVIAYLPATTTNANFMVYRSLK